MHHFAGMSAVVLPLRRRVGRSLSRPPSRAPFYPSRHAHDCPRHAAVATRSSLPASPLRWAPVIVFLLHCLIATAACQCTWNLEPSLLPHHGSAARRAAAVSTPLPGPTAARLLLRATSVGRATHLYLAWPHRDKLPTFTLPGLVNLSTRPHTSSSLKDCCWRVG